MISAYGVDVRDIGNTGNRKAMKKEQEEVIDSIVSEVVATFLRSVHQQRRRIIQLTDKNIAMQNWSFELSENFNNFFQKLLDTPVGFIDKQQLLVKNTFPGPTLLPVSIPGQEEEGEIHPMGDLIDVSKNYYTKMKVVGIFKGKDLLGGKVEQPQSLTTIEKTGCIAFLHNNSNISVSLDICNTALHALLTVLYEDEWFISKHFSSDMFL